MPNKRHKHIKPSDKTKPDGIRDYWMHPTKGWRSSNTTPVKRKVVKAKWTWGSKPTINNGEVL